MKDMIRLIPMLFAVTVTTFGCTFPGEEVYECRPGASRPCYDGPADNLGVGSCIDGLEFCTDEGRWSGTCTDAVHPRAESCNDIDDDCDGAADEGLDFDDDGYLPCVTAAQPRMDCDDGDGMSAPGMNEMCDGRDNDCDGRTDEGFDTDGDGFTACAHSGQPVADCDDGQAHINPGTPEVCNAIDDDCDGQVDEVEPSPESCNGIDDDCDGLVDEGLDRDEDGVLPCVTAGHPFADCDDGRAEVRPGAEELCDGLDNDCDGLSDEGLDLDGDGFTACVHPGQQVADCDEGDRRVNPRAAEACNAVDDDCDGRIDERAVCVSEGIESLSQRVGPLSVRRSLHGLAPSAIAHRAGGLLQACGPAESAVDCAYRWLVRNRRALGLNDVSRELVYYATAVDGAGGPRPAHHVHYRQAVTTPDWGAVPYLGRGLRVHIYGGGVRGISADLGQPPTVTGVERIDVAAAVEHLPEGAELVGEAQYIAWLVPVDGRLEPLAGQTPGFYWRLPYRRADGAYATLFVDAATGDVAADEAEHDAQHEAEGNLGMADASTGQVADGGHRPADPPATPLDRAWVFAADYYDFLLDRLVLDSFDDRGTRLAATVEQPSVGPGDTPCGQCGCVGATCLVGCNSGAGADIRICAGGLSRDTLVHEFNHSLTASRFRDGRNTRLIETEAVEHAITEVLSELHGCWAAAGELVDGRCDWVQVGRDYTRPVVFPDDFDADDRVPGNRLVPGHALFLFAQALGDDRLRVLEQLLDATMRNHLSRTAGLGDLAGSMVVACRIAHWQGTIGLRPGDCDALHAAFVQVGLLEPGCGAVPGGEEICDGFDNDCDGFVDNAPGVAADSTMTRSCFDHDAIYRHVGTCRDGVRSCVDGAWADCEGAVGPQGVDLCGGGNEDCDFQDDEDGEIEMMFDGDGDGFGSDAPTRVLCPDRAGPGWVPARGRPVDCDDGDPNVRPDAPELCNRIDDNCDGRVDEGCGCDPDEPPRLCGPTRCPGQPWGTPNCGLPNTGGQCQAGQQRCEWDAGRQRFVWSEVCLGAERGGAEICDGIDNDCDGRIDDGVVAGRGLPVACGPLDAGRQMCTNGRVECVGNGGPIRVNACGGLADLTDAPNGPGRGDAPGEICPGGGTWTCESPNSMICLRQSAIFASGRIIANDGNPFMAGGDNIRRISHAAGRYRIDFETLPPHGNYIVLTTLANEGRNADNVAIVAGTDRTGFDVVTIDASNGDDHSNNENFNFVVFIP